MNSDMPTKPSSRMRLGRVDIARGIALIAMAIYHIGWDFEFFGYLSPGTTAHGGWKLFARCIAASFLILVGFSLVLAHGRGIRWRAFGKRLLQIGAAAAAITAVTYAIDSGNFIFFGILHQIALATVLGLAFLRLPAPVTLIVAAFVISAPLYARSALFDHPALSWVGLATVNPRSNDYVPLFPWFGAVLIGIALARIFQHKDWMHIFSGGIKPQWLERGLTFIGKHGLAFYLIHQPVLMSIVFALSQIYPPAVLPAREAFVRSCVQSCESESNKTLCTQFCGCVVSELDKKALFDSVFSGELNPGNSEDVANIVQSCSRGPAEPPQ